ncbi:MAG: efflux RND transporter periplasmic adaptor subunit [Deltaproteobacteria bacterium]|nr:efflux RND transporter periplasmic adaptor subunit [Deltaproteobacteria bacterium]
MTWKRLVLALVAIAVTAFLASAVQLWSREDRHGAPKGPAADAALRADVYVVEPQAVRDVVRTVGTLVANESVRVVSELSRRMVKVHVEEGTEVKKGGLLFQLDDADLRAQLAELEVRRHLAATTLDRQKTLLGFRKKALSQQAYDQAVAELQATLAQIASLRVTLAKTEIRAPFDGRVGLRHVSEGAWITPDTMLTTLQDTSRIKIDFAIPERYASALSRDQTFRFRVEGGSREFEGRVAAIEPVIDAPTRSLLVRGVSENPSGVLLPGAFASVELTLKEENSGILVPSEAVMPSATGHSVFVLREGRAQLQEVEVGVRTRDAVQVLSGLSFGDTVLTSNLLRLRPDMPVEPARASAP